MASWQRLTFGSSGRTKSNLPLLLKAIPRQKTAATSHKADLPRTTQHRRYSRPTGPEVHASACDPKRSFPIAARTSEFAP
jgi:hypothetical protein